MFDARESLVVEWELEKGGSGVGRGGIVLAAELLVAGCSIS